MISHYLSRGWCVFPLKPQSKLPLTQHGVLEASNDLAQIQAWRDRWPACGWGLAAGMSGLLVIDLDGEAGIMAWRELQTALGAPPTLTSRTGSGGYHLIYTDRTGRGRNTAGLLAPHVDTRGRGGYIVAPPSIHPNGTAYRWVRKITPQPAPPAILELIDPPPKRVRAPVIADAYGTTPYGERTLHGILTRLSTASDGERHTLNHWAGVRAGQLYAAGHVTTTALSDVITTALGIRRNHSRAERDAREGWEWGVEHPGDYPPATGTRSYIDAPTIYTPRIRVPR